MKRISPIVFLMLLFSFSYSQPVGSVSMIHTHSARTFDKGRLEVKTDMNFFTRATQFVGKGQTPQNFTANNYWLVAAGFSLTYGFSDNFDVTIAPKIYQDTHYANEYNLPGDVFITVKGGSFAFAKRKFYAAGMAHLRLGTGEVHNYPFAEYASGATEYGFTGALSYYMDPYLPDRALNAHLNLGWWNHNEAGNVVYSEGSREYKATANSHEFQFASGLAYPTAMFDFMLELNGIIYIQDPDPFVYSKEDWFYLTPGVRYKPADWLTMNLGMDLRVWGTDDYTNYNLVSRKTNKDYNLPNYAAWKIHMGVNVRILPFVPQRRTSAQIEKDEFKKRIKFFQEIVQDRERTDDVQEELDKLKEEREAAERELEELKQILQEEEK